jgi:hypothetical protein
MRQHGCVAPKQQRLAAATLKTRSIQAIAKIEQYVEL